MKEFLLSVRVGVLSVIFLAISASNVVADLQRGLKNYLSILNGTKKIEQLTPEEQVEVLDIYRRLQSRGRSNTTGKTEYVIEYAHNDELFIINGEKYAAKTYCLGWEAGESVVFLEGSAFGACASAEMLNVNRNERCEVWCE